METEATTDDTLHPRPVLHLRLVLLHHRHGAGVDGALMPCTVPNCPCREKQPLTHLHHAAWVAWMEARAREARHLFCTICRIDPPKHPGGPCDACSLELGGSE